ncbi:MAG: hypothetical protein HYV28_15810, partial [Ignavibacteriales bacterium]|nr:hypothetical protein [Ignavibacteriales bacterium]
MRKFLLTLLLCGTALYAGNITVTFQANMKVQMKMSNFNAATDTLVVRGDFQVDAGAPANWGGNQFRMTDANGDS